MLQNSEIKWQSSVERRAYGHYEILRDSYTPDLVQGEALELDT
jgi:hypothetical protein